MRKTVYFVIGGVVSVIAIIVLTVVLVVIFTRSNDELLPPCDSEIYCHGDFLHHVALSIPEGVDSKTFVDLAMLNDEETILTLFDAFMKATGNY